jgi:hypothetical protein
MCDEKSCADIIDLGSATELTLGDPEEAFYENVTMKDHRD